MLSRLAVISERTSAKAHDGHIFLGRLSTESRKHLTDRPAAMVVRERLCALCRVDPLAAVHGLTMDEIVKVARGHDRNSMDAKKATRAADRFPIDALIAHPGKQKKSDRQAEANAVLNEGVTNQHGQAEDKRHAEQFLLQIEIAQDQAQAGRESAGKKDQERFKDQNVGQR